MNPTLIGLYGWLYTFRLFHVYLSSWLRCPLLATAGLSFDQIVAPKQHDGNLAMVKHLFGGFPSPMLVHQVSSCHLQVHLNQGHETWTPIQSSSNDQSLSFSTFFNRVSLQKLACRQT